MNIWPIFVVNISYKFQWYTDKQRYYIDLVTLTVQFLDTSNDVATSLPIVKILCPSLRQL